MNRGEVWWIEHPDMGRRPVCILTRQEAIGVLNRILVMPATTHARGIPTEVPLGRDDGMPLDCVLTADNLEPVPKRTLIEPITRLGPARLNAVCRALAAATGC